MSEQQPSNPNSFEIARLQEGYSFALPEKSGDPNPVESYAENMWHGGGLQTAEEIESWFAGFKDPAVLHAIRHRSITYSFANALFKRFGQLDETLDFSPSTRLGVEVDDLRRRAVVPNFTGILSRVATYSLGVTNSETYRLLYHAGVEMHHEDPDRARSMRNFLSMLDDNNRPPDVTTVVANLQRPITLEDTRWLRAVSELTSEGHVLKGELRPSFAVDSALAGFHNLLRFIHEQRPHEESRTNAQAILGALGSQGRSDVYDRLRSRTNQMPSVPYTVYIKLANNFSADISRLEGMKQPLVPLDDESIKGLPQALDRILYVACLGNVSDAIAKNPEAQSAISMARSAIDGVIEQGVTKKLGPVPVTIQDAAVALQLHLPPAEAAAALARMVNAKEVPRSRDALNRRIRTGRERWVEDRLARPGYGKLS